MTDKHLAVNLEHQVEQAREIKRLRKEVQRLKYERDQAVDSYQTLERHMDAVWSGVFPSTYGPWEYGGQFERHVLAAFRDLKGSP